LRAYNSEADERQRSALLRELLGRVGDDAVVQAPFTCDYGYNIALGQNGFVNYGASILDVSAVRVGDHVQIGTAVQILTPSPHAIRSCGGLAPNTDPRSRSRTTSGSAAARSSVPASPWGRTA
jgi:acetyltransferase-like isoleucine patch superfamily enzyme